MPRPAANTIPYYEPGPDQRDHTVIEGVSHEIHIAPERAHTLGAHLIRLAAANGDPQLLETATALDAALRTNRPGAQSDAEMFLEGIHTRPDRPAEGNGNGYAGSQQTELFRIPHAPEPAHFNNPPPTPRQPFN